MGTDFGLAMESMQVDEVDPYTEPKPVSDALGQEAVGIYRKIIFLDDNSDGAIKIKEGCDQPWEAALCTSECWCHRRSAQGAAARVRSVSKGQDSQTSAHTARCHVEGSRQS